MPDPVITRTSKRRYPSGLLKKMVVPNTSINKIYTIANGSEFSTVTVRVMNTCGQPATFKLWIADSDKQPSLVDTIEPNITLQENQVFISTGICLSYNESIYIQSTQSNIVTRVEGLENVI